MQSNRARPLVLAAVLGALVTLSNAACDGDGMNVVEVVRFDVLVVVDGVGAGGVVSSPVGIDCPADCDEAVESGTALTLTALAEPGSTFLGWSGGCTGTGPCVLTVDAAVAVSATFGLAQHTVQVDRLGGGSGTVTADVGDIDCGSTCTGSYEHGSTVVLTAVAAPGSSFTGWSGGGCTGTGTCSLSIEAATTVGATFELTGTISLLEISVLTPGTAGTFFGQGIRASIVFEDDPAVPATLEEDPGSDLGCKAWVHTPSEAAATAIGVDRGPVQFNSPAGGAAALLPSCIFTAGVGYRCPHPATESTGGTIAMGPAAGTATLTDVDTYFNAGNTTNRFVMISGAQNAGNNGVFPILALGSVNTIVFANPAVVAEVLPVSASHINLAGVGATPSVPDPGFLEDAASIDFVHDSGGAGGIAAFTASTGVAGSVGDDFVLAIGELNRLNAIPRDGSEFTVTCSAGDCPLGSASGSRLEIVTTDGPTAGLSPFAMPSPTTKQVRIRCTALGSSSVTVPAAYSSLLSTSGATRIQASFIRPTFLTGGPVGVTAFAGHAIVGYSN